MKTLAELAELVNGSIEGLPTTIINGVADLASASEGEITFLAKGKKSDLLLETGASAAVVSLQADKIDSMPLIRVEDPYLAIAVIHNDFIRKPFEPTGIHKTAVIGADCKIPTEVKIGALVSLGDRVKIGKNVSIFPGTVIGDDVVIGEETEIKANVTIGSGCLIGKRVIIHPGAAIGNDGFGYATDKMGHHLKRPHVGIVQIDDDVEIGANTCVDRATFGRTWIKRGTKIDNLVQVAHNVVIGEDSILVSQVGIAGSASLGTGVIIGGQTAISNHVKLGSRVMIGAKSGVHNDQPDNSVISGIPAFSHRIWLRASSIIPKLPQLVKDVRQIKKQVEMILNEKKA